MIELATILERCRARDELAWEALVRPGDHVVMDGLAHACLQEGAYSATGNVHLHGQLNLDSVRRHLRRIRNKDPKAAILVVSESLFSMDSATPDLVAFTLDSTPSTAFRIEVFASTAADASGSSLGSSMTPGAWLDLNDAGWPGRAALLRLVLVAAAGWVAMRPERIIDPQSAMLAWGIPGAALVTVALGRVDGPVAVIGVLVGIAEVGCGLGVGPALVGWFPRRISGITSPGVPQTVTVTLVGVVGNQPGPWTSLTT